MKHIAFTLLIIFSGLVLSFTTKAAESFSVLVFSKTAGYRHASISAGIAAIKKLGLENNFVVDATEDATLFTLTNLQKYKVVIFLSTTGDVLNAAQQLAFEKYIGQGGGFVGIHAASDTEYDWPWYGGLVGAYFESHPPGTPTATVKVSDHIHPSTRHLPYSWTRTDEWYSYQENPRGKVHVLAALDERTYTGGTMGADHPIAWCHSYSGGRSWYTGGGHTIESYSEPHFIQHILGGIMYAAGIENGIFDATIEKNFQLTIINNNPNQPMALEVLESGKVLYIERWGGLNLYDPATSIIKPAGSVQVDNQHEDGLLGLVLDPNYKLNNWIYLFYSPKGTEQIQRVSRFVFKNDTLHSKSEKILLTIPVQRQECCHSGGDMKFDSQGNLYIATGDNTNPFQSGGYSPIDERAGRANFDAQRTAGNTMDFRGKILRIKPQDDGSYTIPSGNLFTNPSEGKPEIFVMGNRNPFRISIDRKTNFLYWGEVGPDASGDGVQGPKGYDEFNRTNTAGNFGWPYCIANNRSYADYNFATAKANGFYNCESPINNSPNNTGAQNLPPAKGAWIWYPYTSSLEFPELGVITGRTAMAGPVYHYDSTNTNKSKLPAYFNKSLFIYEWSNNWVKEVKINDEGGVVAINPILTKFKFARPIDMKIGPDGAMYIIEWGTGYFGDNPDARIVKISFTSEGRNPVAVIQATPDNGKLPLSVSFSGRESYDDDGDNLQYYWDFDNNGVEDATGINATYTYTSQGRYTARLRIVDNTGKQSVALADIVVGNIRPAVTITKPKAGGFFNWSDTIPFAVSVVDSEEGSTTQGTIPCNLVKILPAVGHDDHAHDETMSTGCEGSLLSPSGHGSPFDGENTFYLISASYQDKGIAGLANTSLLGSKTAIIRPKRVQAEHFSSSQNIVVLPSKEMLGGGKVVRVAHGSTLSFTPISLENIQHLTYRLRSNRAGFIEMRSDSVEGPVISRRFIPAKADTLFDYYGIQWDNSFIPTSIHFVFIAQDGAAGSLFDLNWIDFYGKGMASPYSEKEGLLASYYVTAGSSSPLIQILEPLVAFDWSDLSPFPVIPPDGFKVEWKGHITPPVSATYTFRLLHQQGSAELVLGPSVVIAPSVADSAKLDLIEGRKYPITVKYTHSTGPASIQLRWRNGTQPYQAVGQQYLSPIDVLTSIEHEAGEHSGNAIKVKPNPAKETLWIETSDDEGYHLDLVSLTGQTVFQTEKEFKHRNELAIDHLIEGVYLLKVHNHSKKWIQKIVIVK